VSLYHVAGSYRRIEFAGSPVAIRSRFDDVGGPLNPRIGTVRQLALVAIALTTASGAISAQGRKARPEDVSTIDGLIKAYYEVVSGPAGSLPDSARDHTIHHPDARITLLDRKPDGTTAATLTTLDGFYRQFGAGPRQKGFYEHEIHRVTQRIGSLVHIWSTYESSETPNGKPYMRGINSIQAFWDGKRFWITSWVFDDERNGNRVPKEYLP
jgi:hypothetical protein